MFVPPSKLNFLHILMSNTKILLHFVVDYQCFVYKTITNYKFLSQIHA